MPATIAPSAVSGCGFGLTSNLLSLAVTTSATVTLKRDKKELRGIQGGVKAVAYYNPTAEISIEGYGTATATIGNGIQVSGLPTMGQGQTIVEEISYTLSNDDFQKSSVRAVQYAFQD